jgi:hypothetical protein
MVCFGEATAAVLLMRTAAMGSKGMQVRSADHCLPL